MGPWCDCCVDHHLGQAATLNPPSLSARQRNHPCLSWLQCPGAWKASRPSWERCTCPWEEYCPGVPAPVWASGKDPGWGRKQASRQPRMSRDIWKLGHCGVFGILSTRPQRRDLRPPQECRRAQGRRESPTESKTWSKAPQHIHRPIA